MSQIASLVRRSPRVGPASPRSPGKVAKLDKKEFAAHIKLLVEESHALTSLSTAMGSTPKAHTITIQLGNGRVVALDRRGLKSQAAAFQSRLRELNKYFKAAIKRSRDPAISRQQRLDLRSVWKPVYIKDTPLGQFLAAAKLGPDFGGNQLSALKDGFVLRNTITMIMFTYAHANGNQDPNNGQYVRSDTLMDQAFGGEIDATFNGELTSKVDSKGFTKYETAKRYMVNSGEHLNTYKVLQKLYPASGQRVNKKGVSQVFNSQALSTYMFQSITSLNSYSMGDLQQGANLGDAEYQAILDSISSDAMRKRMSNEHDLVKSVNERYGLAHVEERKARKKAKAARQ